MLKISKMADYGTIILTTMASDPEQARSVAEIGSMTGLPAPSVSKILKILIRQGMVSSLRGAKGGYKLSRSPAEISTAQILQAIDGPIGMTECSTHPGSCHHEAGCQVRPHWQRVNRAMLQALEQISLKQMMAPLVETVDLRVLRARVVSRPAARQGDAS